MTPDVLKEGFLALPRCHARPGATPFAAQLWQESLTTGLSKWEAYQWLRLSAAHTEREREIAGHRCVEPRGHLIASTRWLADSWGWTRAKVLHFLGSLEKAGEIETIEWPKTKQCGALIRLVRYEDFCLDSRSTEQTTEQTTLRGGTESLTMGAQTTQQTTQQTESKNIENLEIADNARTLHGEPNRKVGLATQLTIAANQGLMDNPSFGESHRPILAGWATTLDAAFCIEQAGVDPEWARRFIYGAAKALDPAKVAGGTVGSLKFFVARTVGAWQRAVAKGEAKGSVRPLALDTTTKTTPVRVSTVEAAREAAERKVALRRAMDLGDRWWNRMKQDAGARDVMMYAAERVDQPAEVQERPNFLAMARAAGVK